MAAAITLAALLGAVLSLAGALVALVAALFRRSVVALRAGRGAALVALSVLVLAVVVVACALLAPSAFAELLTDDPESRAVVLASLLAELLNCAAPALPALVVAGSVWLWAARRERAMRRG